jgi:hypothetical protein
VEITTEDIPDTVAKFADLRDPVTRFFVDEIGFSDVRSWGVLVNSFAALDAGSRLYATAARAWIVGPLFLAAGDTTELDEELDPEGCLAWLDAHQPGSVVTSWTSSSTRW